MRDHGRLFSLIFKTILAAGGLGLLLILLPHLGEVSPTSSETRPGEIVMAPRVVLVAKVVSIEVRPPGSSLPDRVHVEIEEVVEVKRRSVPSGAESAESSRLPGLGEGTVLELRALYGLAPVTVEYRPATEGDPDSSAAAPTTTAGSELSPPGPGSGPEVRSIVTGLVDEVTRFHLPGLGPGDRIRAEISYFGKGMGSIGLYEVLRAED